MGCCGSFFLLIISGAFAADTGSIPGTITFGAAEPVRASSLRPDPTGDPFDQPGDPIPLSLGRELKNKYAPGVAYIESKDPTGKFVATGTFVSPDGHLVTNLHVLKEYKLGKAAAPTFRLPNGDVVTRFEMLACDGPESKDLCLLKIDYRPAAWFPVRGGEPAKDEKLYMLGHPGRSEWDLRAGRFVGPAELPRSHAPRWEVTVPVMPGFSGGPIFTGDGKLVCIASNRVAPHTHRGVPCPESHDGIHHYCVGAELILELLMDPRVGR